MVDVRWYLDPAQRGRDAYAAGHLPGAVFLDVDEDLSGPGGGRGSRLGRHPWPSSEHLAKVLSRVGVGRHTRVVAYDDQAGATACRLWYLLRAHGHAAAAVLDGGLVKWQAEGRPTTTRSPTVAPAEFTGPLQPGFVVELSDLTGTVPPPLLLDARAPERYRGEREPIDPRAGHVPGARNAPYSANLTGGATPVFRSVHELERHYAALCGGKAEPVVYCGSGVSACHDLLALHLVGRPARLYAGSWSEWSAHPELPAATGEE